MRKLLVVLSVFLYGSIGIGAETRDFTGVWTLRIGERTFLALSLQQQGGKILGTLTTPKKFIQNQLVFSDIANEIRTREVVQSSIEGTALHFSTLNEDPHKDNFHYTLKIHGDIAELREDDQNTPFSQPPYPLERIPGNSKVAINWEPNRVYCPGDGDKSNPEMAEIFKRDQQVRMPATSQSSSQLSPSVFETDRERRERTQKLLADGLLHTGRDYFEAALIFQHGPEPEDHLMAHTLAIISLSKGYASALWLASASLDRYLQRIRKPQIYGTQYMTEAGKPASQEPYDRTLISDALRLQLAVPSQSVQEERRKAFSAPPEKK